MKKHGTILMKAAALVMAAMLALSGGCQALQDYALGTLSPVKEPKPQPVLYQKDGLVFMACGGSTLELQGAQILKTGVRGCFSQDNSFFYYIADYSVAAAAGTLMAVSTDCKSDPVTVDTGVYAAAVSPDGKRALLLKNMYYGSGDLYVYDYGKKPEYIANKVVPENWGFSPDGSLYYYGLDNYKGTDGLTLVVKIPGGNYTVERTRLSIIEFGVLYFGNDGKMLYDFNGDIYYHEAGPKSEVAAKNASLIKVCGNADSFIYFSNKALYYKAAGKDAQVLSGKISGMQFQYAGSERDRGTGDSPLDITGNSFMLEEVGNKGIQSIMLYDQQLGKEKTQIAQVFGIARIDHRFSNVVANDMYGALTVIQRTGSGWGKPVQFDEYPSENFEFDSTDKNCYFLSAESSGDIKTTLCSLDLNTGKVTEIMEGVASFSLISDTLYVFTDKGLYRIAGDKEPGLIDGSVRASNTGLIRTQGGVFIIKGGTDMSFLAADSAAPVSVSTGIRLLGVSGNMSQTLPEDVITPLKELYEDAQYYIDWMEGKSTGEPHRTAVDDINLASQLEQKKDMTLDTYYLLSDFSLSFSSLDSYMKSDAAVKDAAFYEKPIDWLTNASKEYETYIKEYESH